MELNHLDVADMKQRSSDTLHMLIQAVEILHGADLPPPRVAAGVCLRVTRLEHGLDPNGDEAI